MALSRSRASESRPALGERAQQAGHLQCPQGDAIAVGDPGGGAYAVIVAPAEVVRCLLGPGGSVAPPAAPAPSASCTLAAWRAGRCDPSRKRATTPGKRGCLHVTRRIGSA